MSSYSLSLALQLDTEISIATHHATNTFCILCVWAGLWFAWLFAALGFLLSSPFLAQGGSRSYRQDNNSDREVESRNNNAKVKRWLHKETVSIIIG